jgi:hypothetical protein
VHNQHRSASGHSHPVTDSDADIVHALAQPNIDIQVHGLLSVLATRSRSHDLAIRTNAKGYCGSRLTKTEKLRSSLDLPLTPRACFSEPPNAVLTIKKKTVSITNKVMILDSLESPILMRLLFLQGRGCSFQRSHDLFVLKVSVVVRVGTQMEEGKRLAVM